MLVFTTFGDSLRYSQALRLISEEAQKMAVFDVIAPYTEKNLDPAWINKHLPFITSNPRGFGYWMWKPQVIKQVFEQLQNDDIVVYADSGCRLNVEGKKRLLEYVQMTKDSEFGNVSFDLGYPEKHWTKGNVLDQFKHIISADKF